MIMYNLKDQNNWSFFIPLSINEVMYNLLPENLKALYEPTPKWD